MSKKFHEATEEFIKAMDLYNVKEIKEIEDKVINLDILQRRRMLNGFLFMVSAFIFFGLQFFYQSRDEYIENLMIQISFVVCVLIGIYFVYKGLEAGSELSAKIEAFKLAKGLYIDSIKKNLLEIPTDLEQIIHDLVNSGLYTNEVATELKVKILKKQIADKDILKMAFDLRTEKTKILAMPSTTITIEDHRKKMEK